MKKVLYLGTSPLHSGYKPEEVIHYPVIRIVPKTVEDESICRCFSILHKFSHILVTSKNSVEVLWALAKQLDVDMKMYVANKCISIGPVTSSYLREKGVVPLVEAEENTQEGVVACLTRLLSRDAYLFYPRSSLARPFLENYLRSSLVSYEVLDLYDTVFQALEPKPLLDEIDEIIFTSPSTVEGFFSVFSKIPSNIQLTFQGPITKNFFLQRMQIFVD